MNSFTVPACFSDLTRISILDHRTLTKFSICTPTFQFPQVISHNTEKLCKKILKQLWLSSWDTKSIADTDCPENNLSLACIYNSLKKQFLLEDEDGFPLTHVSEHANDRHCM